jgi:hypothetical protein
MSTPLPGEPRDHMNALLRVLLPFARDAIGEHGGFFPVGISMAPDGEVEVVDLPTIEPATSADAVLAEIRSGLRARAERREVLAVGVASGVRLHTPEDEAFPLGIRVELEHRDADPITCVIPYRETEVGYEYGEAIAFVGERRTWV